MDIEKAGVGRKRRWGKIQNVAINQRTGDGSVLVRVPFRLAFRVESLRPVVHKAELGSNEMFSGSTVEHEKVTVSGSCYHELAYAPIKRHVDQYWRLGGIPIVSVVRGCLEIPRHLAGIDIDGDQTTGKQIVAITSTLRVGRRRITCAIQVQVRFRIISAWNPSRSIAVTGGFQAGPSLDTRIAGILRRGVENPLQLARFRIHRLEKRR